MTESLKIGENYQGQPDLIVGQSPLGFPVNIELEKQPPVLYEINSHLYHINVNDFLPPLCITTSKDYNYKVGKQSINTPQFSKQSLKKVQLEEPQSKGY